jgi:hypothetical protein
MLYLLPGKSSFSIPKRDFLLDGKTKKILYFSPGRVSNLGNSQSVSSPYTIPDSWNQGILPDTQGALKTIFLPYSSCQKLFLKAGTINNDRKAEI